MRGAGLCGERSNVPRWGAALLLWGAEGSNGRQAICAWSGGMN